MLVSLDAIEHLVLIAHFNINGVNELYRVTLARIYRTAVDIDSQQMLIRYAELREHTRTNRVESVSDGKPDVSDAKHALGGCTGKAGRRSLGASELMRAVPSRAADIAINPVKHALKLLSPLCEEPCGTHSYIHAYPHGRDASKALRTGPLERHLRFPV